jgi:hypothetical protein
MTDQTPAFEPDNDCNTSPKAASNDDLRKRIARAIHRYDSHHALSGNDIPSKHHYGEADFVLAELRTELGELAALRQVARGYCPACGRGDAAPTVDDGEREKQRADQAERLLRRYVDLADITHKYPIMGGHDCIGENHTCAGCALRDEARAALEQPTPDPDAGSLLTRTTDERDRLARAGSVLARLVNAPNAPEHCHTVPPNWDGGGPCEYCTALEEARAIIATETAPAVGQATDHVYLSTGCFHGDHDYCKNMTGLNGAKRPASCKKCGAKCICGCHKETT